MRSLSASRTHLIDDLLRRRWLLLGSSLQSRTSEAWSGRGGSFRFLLLLYGLAYGGSRSIEFDAQFVTYELVQLLVGSVVSRLPHPVLLHEE